jgi:cytochrome c biogenesis protein CcmG/thiol:disulfide interchange protein DsbE
VNSFAGDGEKSLKRLWIVIGATGLLFVGTIVYRRSHTAPQLASTGHPVAPEFSVITIDGKKLALSDCRGKVVLLDFWATWCAPCRDETPRFVRLQDKYATEGFQIIGVSMDDSAEPVRQFYRDFHMNYPVALGGAKLGELYGGVFGLPIAFLIDRHGRILSKHIGATDPGIFDKEVANALGNAADAHP